MYIAEFETTIQCTPCLICVLYWEKYRPAKLSGPPDQCYEAEGGFGEWDVCDRNGERWPELQARMSRSDIARIEREVFEHMERNW